MPHLGFKHDLMGESIAPISFSIQHYDWHWNRQIWSIQEAIQGWRKHLCQNCRQWHHFHCDSELWNFQIEFIHSKNFIHRDINCAIYCATWMSFGSSRFSLKTLLADYWFLELSSYIARISSTEIQVCRDINCATIRCATRMSSRLLLKKI